jgi:uncharacterized protein
MEQAARAVRTIEVTRAVRDADIDGVQVRSGQTLGIYDGRVIVAADSIQAALLECLRQAPTDSMEIITLYYGTGVSEEEAQALAAQVRAAHDGLDVEVVTGGQPHYPYVVSLE